MKKLIVPVVLVAVAIAGWLIWTNQHKPANDDERVLHGNVDIRQISLAFDGTGRIVELRADEGDRLTAGQVIGLLDTQTLELQTKELEAQAEAQRQILLRLHHGSRPEEIERARSQLKSAEADVPRVAKDLARATELQAQGATSDQDLDRARSATQVATAKVEDLQAALRLAQLGPRAEEVAGAAAQLAALEAQLALLRHQIDLAQLRAPADAVVRSRLLEPGDMATAQKPAFALALIKPKWVRVYASEPDLGKIKPGMAARVFTDSQPDRPVNGKVGYISSVAEFTPKSVQTEDLRTSLAYEVRIRVDDEADALRLGQPVTVRLPLRTGP